MKIPPSRGRRPYRASALFPHLFTTTTLLLVLATAPSSLAGKFLSDGSHTSAYRGIDSPDVCVVAAPFVAAAACRDGCVILSFHPELEEFSDGEAKGSGGAEGDEEGPRTRAVIHPSFLSPKRVVALHPPRPSSASAAYAAVAGLRSDANLLSSRARSRLSSEVAFFHGLYNEEGGGEEDFGLMAAEAAHVVLRDAAESESMRTLSCAALVVTTGGGAPPGGGKVYLVDATGGYEARAFCLGGAGGDALSDDSADEDGGVLEAVEQNNAIRKDGGEGEDDKIGERYNKESGPVANTKAVEPDGGFSDVSSKKSVADKVNLGLAEIDFSSMTVEEGVDALLGAVLDSSSGSTPLVPQTGHGKLLRVEVVVVDGQTGKMRRIWGNIPRPIAHTPPLVSIQ